MCLWRCSWPALDSSCRRGEREGRGGRGGERGGEARGAELGGEARVHQGCIRGASEGVGAQTIRAVQPSGKQLRRVPPTSPLTPERVCNAAIL